MDRSKLPLAKGRGSQINPPNRFTRIQFEDDTEYLEHDPDAEAARRARPTEYFADDAQSIVSENDSPDIPFRYSLNVYRGCSHGCSYCYARPTHEYYDLGAGLDFESKIFVKQRAPELFRDWLARDGYQPDSITVSGVTDPYQPIERKLELTRRCLSVALEARQPVAIITKNALVTRDADILSEMARYEIVSVAMSVTTLDQRLSRVMEPRTSAPAAKLRAIEQLASAGVPAHVMIAPVIPGLTDHEIPEILQKARQAGACSAGYILLRLPLSVEPVFLEWLRRAQPGRAEKVESRIRSTRGGRLYEGGFGVRMRGRGPIADQIRDTFRMFARKYELDGDRTRLSTEHFRRPTPSSGQGWLFPA
jgi:DNA repair photolyase